MSIGKRSHKYYHMTICPLLLNIIVFLYIYFVSHTDVLVTNHAMLVKTLPYNFVTSHTHIFQISDQA